MIIGTFAGQLAKVLASNSVDSGGFTAKPPTATEPTGAGVLDLSKRRDGEVPSLLLLKPYGAGANNATLSMRVLGWHLAGGDLWTKTILGEFDCTLSAAVGVAAKTVLDTERFADTIAASSLAVGTAGVDYELLSPANDTEAAVAVDLKGCSKVEVQFNRGSATSSNALGAFL